MTGRRKFLQYAIATVAAIGGAGAWWVTASNRRAARWARHIVSDGNREAQPPKQRPVPSLWSDNRVTFAWLGHATVLINFYGIRILTDPALADRVGVSLGIGTLGPKRHIMPALLVEELPTVDVILLSHAHMDHMDLRTLRKFPRDTLVVSARRTTDILRGARRNKVVELGWGQTHRVQHRKGTLDITAIEVKHWGERWPSDTERGYNGYIIRREDKSVLFGGDTAMTPLFRDLTNRGPHHAAIMPIGAYRPWIRNHCTPEEAVEMTNAAGADYIIPVHHLTFKLSDEPMEEPLERLEARLEKSRDRIGLRRPGETFVLPS